jgi:hypothetical protein
MVTVIRRAERLMWIGLAAIGLGLSVLLVYSWIEVINNPGLSLVDGYGIGRLPWIPIGISLVLGGGCAALAGGAAVIVVRGDWLRRILLVPIVLVPVAWWLTALGILAFPRFAGPDPVTFAYSLPETAAVALLLPCLAAAALAALPIGPDRRVRMRAVHAADALAHPGDRAEPGPE